MAKVSPAKDVKAEPKLKAAKPKTKSKKVKGEIEAVAA